MTQTGTQSPTQPVLEIKDLKTYFFLEKSTVRALDGVDLTLPPKSTLGLVGESGCGKSMMAMSVMRLIQSPPGKIVNGEINLHRRKTHEVVDIVKLDPRGAEMRSIRGGEIAIVFQEPMTSLNPLYTVGDQIAESVELHHKLSHKEALDRALEMLTKVQISAPKQRLKEYPHQLSGGMRQRVMIALALSCNPSILIADEPTTALDVTTEAQILSLMRSLQNELGMAFMFITHNLGVVAQMADSVAVMYLGKVVEETSVDAIFYNPLHPYTKALLQSIPRLGMVKGRDFRLASIKGSVPDPYNLPKGCPFHPRCAKRIRGICDVETPEVIEVEPGHKVRCVLYRKS